MNFNRILTEGHSTDANNSIPTRSNYHPPASFHNWFGHEDYLNDLSHWGNFRNWAAPPPNKNITCTGNIRFQDYPDQWKLEIDLPGRRQDEIKIWVEGKKLDIQVAARQGEEINNDQRSTWSLRTFNAGQHTCTIPENVEINQIKGKLQHGLLTLIMPKKKEAQQNNRRQIQLDAL